MSRSHLVALSDVQEALPNVWEWSGYSLGCPGVIKRPSRMSGSGREALPDVWGGREALTDVQERSGVSPGFPGVVRSLSRMSGSVRKALPDVREWLGGPPGCPGVVG